MWPPTLLTPMAVVDCLPWEHVTRDIFPLPRFAPCPPFSMTPRTLQQRRKRRSHLSECKETIDSLNWLASFKEPSRQLVSPFVVCGRRGLCKVSTFIFGILSAGDSWHLEAASVGPTARAVFSKLLRSRGSDDAAAVGLASYCSGLVSLTVAQWYRVLSLEIPLSRWRSVRSACCAGSWRPSLD